MDVLKLGVLLLAISLLAGCGEDNDDTTGTALPERSEERLIENGAEPERVQEDPTPQTSTGGEVPGYSPAAPVEPAEEPDAPREETDD